MLGKALTDLDILDLYFTLKRERHFISVYT
jgi:hypothetical protein